MSARYLIPLAVAAALAGPTAALAQDAGTYDPGKWLFRVGISQVNPDSYNLALNSTTAVVVDSDLSPTATVEYFLTKHIGTELLVAWPFTHGIDLDTGSRPLDRVAHTDLMPPALSLNWHFNPDGMFRPYIGAGVMYALFSGEETQGALAGNSLKLDDSIGATGQVGVDIGNKTSNWFFNANVRYVDLSTDASLNGDDIGEVELNPWIYGLHIGYRFGHTTPPPAPAPVVAPPPPPPPAPAKCGDDDADGVCNEADKCPGTPAGTKVDSVGCPLEQTLKLLFDFDSAELRPESITELERVVKFMGDVPFAKALVEGHTDSVGADAYNMALSDRRAKAVFDYLSSRGVDPARLSSVGKGETAPIADNKTAEGRQENRRVMLIRTDSGM
jgi:outer membrane protein